MKLELRLMWLAYTPFKVGHKDSNSWTNSFKGRTLWRPNGSWTQWCITMCRLPNDKIWYTKKAKHTMEKEINYLSHSSPYYKRSKHQTDPTSLSRWKIHCGGAWNIWFFSIFIYLRVRCSSSIYVFLPSFSLVCCAPLSFSVCKGQNFNLYFIFYK